MPATRCPISPLQIFVAFIVLPLLLLMLLDSADLYFGPNLSGVAQLTNMRPRVAGGEEAAGKLAKRVERVGRRVAMGMGGRAATKAMEGPKIRYSR